MLSHLSQEFKVFIAVLAMGTLEFVAHGAEYASMLQQILQVIL